MRFIFGISGSLPALVEMDAGSCWEGFGSLIAYVTFVFGKSYPPAGMGSTQNDKPMLGTPAELIQCVQNDYQNNFIKFANYQTSPLGL
jgi:hypothetical protein